MPCRKELDKGEELEGKRVDNEENNNPFEWVWWGGKKEK